MNSEASPRRPGNGGIGNALLVLGIVSLLLSSCSNKETPNHLEIQLSDGAYSCDAYIGRASLDNSNVYAEKVASVGESLKFWSNVVASSPNDSDARLMLEQRSLEHSIIDQMRLEWAFGWLTKVPVDPQRGDHYLLCVRDASNALDIVCWIRWDKSPRMDAVSNAVTTTSRRLLSSLQRDQGVWTNLSPLIVDGAVNVEALRKLFLSIGFPEQR